MDADDTLIKTRKAPLCNAPKIIKGNIPVDNSFLLLTDAEKEEYIIMEPNGAKYIRPFIGAKELIYDIKRWCFWLVDVDPSEFRNLPLLRERIEGVRRFRLASKKEATRKYAELPFLFMEIRQPKRPYLAIPEVSSINRKYIPMSFFEPNVITNSKLRMIEGANLYHFGVLQSAMHMTWTRQVCGRLRLDFQYSNDVVYNNFVWPQDPRHQDVQIVSKAAEEILAIREQHPRSSLADLYDLLAMPKDLLDAHKRLDKAVDRCYRREAFKTDAERLRFLFERYIALTASEAKP